MSKINQQNRKIRVFKWDDHYWVAVRLDDSLIVAKEKSESLARECGQLRANRLP